MITSIITDYSVGGTFLSWSLHYLAGHDKYFSTGDSQLIDLVDSPINKRKNAHGFKSNQPNSMIDFNQILPILTTTITDSFHTIYFHPITNIADTITITRELQKHSKKTILVNQQNHELALYRSTYVKRNGRRMSHVDPSKVLRTDDEYHEDLVNYFFKDSKQKWNDLKLTEIWDQREFIALNFKPFITESINDVFDFSIDHYLINQFDLYHNFENGLIPLFDYLEIELFQPRLENWHKVYNMWREIHSKQLLFIWYFDTIIDYILHGYSMDLSRFELNIIHEATIQHAMIYKHNLNFKTWQLNKFQNTRQLHELLEPNIHPL